MATEPKPSCKKTRGASVLEPAICRTSREGREDIMGLRKTKQQDSGRKKITKVTKISRKSAWTNFSDYSTFFDYLPQTYH
jgi:hypothetical protein